MLLVESRSAYRDVVGLHSDPDIEWGEWIVKHRFLKQNN
ncbi:hypothetical protein PITC_062110 [Penicillium italicum]|uniref:Uncharacterized protein n=1 Tax=Penicillium italicum TaxID=40296 RepID=A0A0A2L1A8_PENIT|nr:hypothetical protein PITC_062110 [Penicillium italicum]